jgi:hypothetical protein
MGAARLHVWIDTWDAILRFGVAIISVKRAGP